MTERVAHSEALQINQYFHRSASAFSFPFLHGDRKVVTETRGSPGDIANVLQRVKRPDQQS